MWLGFTYRHDARVPEDALESWADQNEPNQLPTTARA